MALSMRLPVMRFLNLISRRRLNINQCSRLLLTDEYKCHNEWNLLLKSPVLQKINTNDFINKLTEKIDKDTSVSAIDIEIVACKLESLQPSQVDLAVNLLHRFRHSKNAVHVRESLSHSVIRSLLHLGATDQLMSILRDKINYGIFLDHFTANLLLDHFIKTQCYQEAAEVAVDLMLQEDLGNPLTRALSLYACHLRLAHLLEVEPSAEAAAETADDEDIVYKRVSFIENPWYDDHFDIPSERQRVGKTLAVLASSSEGADGALNRGYELIGWALYEKLNKVQNLVRKWIDNPLVAVAVNSTELEIVKKAVDGISTKEPSDPKEPGLVTLEDLYPRVTAAQKASFIDQFSVLCDELKAAGKIGATSKDSASLELARRVVDTALDVSAKDAADLKALYAQWSSDLQRDLDQQTKRILTEKKKRELAERLVALRNREEKLRFFEQQTKIDLIIADTPPELPIQLKSVEEQFVAPPSERRPSGADAMKKGR